MRGQARVLRAWGPQAPLLRGDELMAALGMPAGPEVGRVLAQLEEDRYAGEVSTGEQALRRAKQLLDSAPD